MAVAALLLWLCTAAVGSYLLLTGAHSVSAGPDPGPEDEPAFPAPVPAVQPAADSGAAQARA